MDLGFLIILVGGMALLWFMSSRTRKQQQEAARFRDNLEAGQEVMTGSGLFGTVVGVDGERVTLEIAPGVTSEWLKPAIAKLVEPPLDDAEDEGEEYADDEYDEDEDYDEEYDEYEEEDGAEPSSDEGADVEIAWQDIEVPDDASSLTEEGTPDLEGASSDLEGASGEDVASDEGDTPRKDPR